MCDVEGCLDNICAVKCSILEKAGFSAGDIEKLLVVCPYHAKNHKPAEIIHQVHLRDEKCMVWLYTIGVSSHTICVVCGQCPLYIWQSDAEVCHVKAEAQGGTRALDNLVIGKHGCNKKQGAQHLNEFHKRIRRQANARQVVVPEEKLVDVLKELQSRCHKKTKKSPVARMQDILKATAKPSMRQTRIK
jgi:5-methylcytosine-specific restriction endonuclease McrA